MRNATLTDLSDLLKNQHVRKMDVVAPASSITAEDGFLTIEGTDAVLTESGVTMGDGIYLPTSICDEGIAAKLGVPLAYVRKMRAERVDLWDANVNGWLRGSGKQDANDWDTRSFLVRCFRADDEVSTGVARAFLSDSFKVIDNLDVLMSALEGIADAGVEINVDGCDLSDRRMYVRISAPQVEVAAKTLLKGYRSPFTGESGTDNPMVFAGFVVSNSEVGQGSFNIVPRITVRVCKNGMAMSKDAMRKVHLGGRLDEGVVNWSTETQERSLALVKSMTRDSVRTFLDSDYLTKTIVSLEEKAEEPVATVDAVKVLTKPLRFTPEQMDGILSMFVQGGQMSRGGVMNAITAHAQSEDADTAAEMETQAVSLLV